MRLGQHLRRTQDGSFFQEAKGAALPRPFAELLRGLLPADPLERWQSALEALEALDTASGRAVRPLAVPTFETAIPIGRDDVLQTVEEAVASVSTGSSRLVTIAIEAGEGLGKTRLLREALDLALRSGLRAWDWVVAREASQRRRGSGSGRGEWTDDGDWADDSTSAVSRAERADHLAERFLRVVSEAPTLVVLDGVDRADEMDREILRAVVEKAYSRLGRVRRGSGRSRTTLPVFVLSATPRSLARDLEAAAIWRRILTLPHTSRFELLPWTHEESRQYLERALRPARSLGAAEDTLLREGAGSPDRSRRILRELCRREALQLRDGIWVLEGDESRTEMAIPGDREGLLRSWTTLSSLARDILSVSALWSNPDERASSEVLGRVLNLPDHRLREGLLEIEEIDGLTPTVGSPTARFDAPYLNRRERAWILRLAALTRRTALRRSLAACEIVPPLERLFQRIRLGPVSLDRVMHETRSLDAASRRVLASYSRSSSVGADEQSEAAVRLGEWFRLSGEAGSAERFLRIATRSPRRECAARANLLLAELRSAGGQGDLARRCFERVGDLLDPLSENG